MTAIVKLDLGNKHGSIWIEADEIPNDKPSGRESVGLGSEAVAKLASAFE